ncbi:MAG: septal ring lytic transglycosylase RlpA family protein [Bryobacteraceae bacterium]
MRSLLAPALLLCLLIAGCGGKKSPRAVKAVPKSVGSTETGIASWYGHPYHGRRSANGEVYDMEQSTAAHRTLPFGTWVRIKNLSNDKTVEVRITDRGPFIRKRIIDLSKAAARSIDLIGPGITKVKLTVIAGPTKPVAAATVPVPISRGPAAPATFAVQVGAFSNKANAERLRLTMEKRYGGARLVTQETSPSRWRVLVGSERTELDAEALAARIRSEIPEATGTFVVRIDGDHVGDRI